MSTEKHSKACEMAKGNICKCSCEGRLHGIGVQTNGDNENSQIQLVLDDFTKVKTS